MFKTRHGCNEGAAMSQYTGGMSDEEMVLERWENEGGQRALIIDENPSVIARYGMEDVPALILFAGGKRSRAPPAKKRPQM